MADRSRCPNCGERVQPFAAGCAICGADLDTKRWDTGPSTVQRAGSWFSSIGFGPGVSITTFVIGAIVVYFLLQVL
jgi:hypothetical protein